MKRFLILLFSISLIAPVFVISYILIKDNSLREYVSIKLKHFTQNDLSKAFKFNNNKFNEIVNEIEVVLSDSSVSLLENQIYKKLNSTNNQNFGKSSWKYVKSTIVNEYGDSLRAKVRIRGDMPSNFNKGIKNATLRVNLKEGSCFGKTKFSLIRPTLENHGFYGFLYYKFMKENKLLANDFIFVKLKNNSKENGIYIFQEAFNAELYHNYSDGIIFKTHNDCYDKNGEYNPNKNPKISPYEYNKITKNHTKKIILGKAIEKYHLMNIGKTKVDSVLDVKKYAYFIAVNDLFAAHHSHFCQNIRLFYNSNSNLFEPIAWDPNNFARFLLGEQTCVLNVTDGFNEFFNELLTNEHAYPIYRKLLSSDKFLYYYSLELFNLAHNNKIYEFIKTKIDTIKTIEPSLFRQNFQTTFDISLIKKRIEKVKKNSKKSSNINSLVSYKDTLLNIELSSNNLFPLRVLSISFSSDTISLNKTLFGEPLSFSLKKLHLSTNNLKYKINYRFLNSSELLSEFGYLIVK
jgi:hypothetical protein